jgi:hypothetical protein
LQQKSAEISENFGLSRPTLRVTLTGLTNEARRSN